MAVNRYFGSNGDIILAVGVIVILIVMIFPMPTQLMDFLLAMNIALSLTILLVSMYITQPLQFSVFPGLLLVVTLFRLSLNVATTRLILGNAFAGHVVSAFGSFVVKGNYVVGLIIFLILVIINFVVITKGAGRIAEVAARFTLDAMPGRQMAVDADLNAGLIDEAEARRRREEISRQADFYGAMDGASKFVRGDAVAGLVITSLNIVGGIIIGLAQMKMSIGEALRTYTVLTVGDGLVSQIPALIISTAAGIVVTRTASESNLGREVLSQVFANPRAIFVTSGVLLFLAVAPGLPTIPFLLMAAATGFIGYRVSTAQRQAQEEATQTKKPVEPEKEVEEYLRIDPLELEIGYSLIPLVDPEQGGDILNRITQMRKQFAMEVGMVLPPIRIRDNIQLKPTQYVIKVRGEEVARHELMLSRLLALNPGTATEEIEGIKTVEPAFGLKAKWIEPSKREQAEVAGYTVVEPAAVLITHMMEVLRAQAHRILGRQEVKNLLDTLKKDHPAVVEDLVPNQLSLGTVERVLQNLLKEGVPIRDLVTILETLADYAPVVKDVDTLTELVRQSLGHVIAKRCQDEDGVVRAITLDPEIDELIRKMSEEVKRAGVVDVGTGVVLPPHTLQQLYRAITAEVERVAKEGRQPIIITSPQTRMHFRRLIEPVLSNVTVISFGELPASVNVESIGIVRLTHDREAVSSSVGA
ncbi:MAG: flagellar biosynthesis protein FlhA [candidate division KSB1 bacterium]|nr:flagellar biosynthesis protein FlhA [candidate division KSB1 bacterium]MDZ7393392.1 flagellar biosynthesis protein FlhA [candidate division KSB1 bacterium]MDZ7414325.1 flagellar biosynthesis protein FlhA [candidate division KSB1 bacterium]